MHEPRRQLHAFTLIELLISIALVLVLMVGVNFVFSSVGQATGLTQAVSRVTRDAQAAQSRMYGDFSTAVTRAEEAPCIVIRSLSTTAFRSRADYISTVDQSDPMMEIDSQTETQIQHNRAVIDNRIHRTDLLLFFARDKFPRQTGGGTLNGSVAVNPYIADMSTQEAMIWYGHLKLPDDSSSAFMNPGAGTLQTNPNNFFADQWILGRVAILLQEPDRDTSGPIVPPRIRTVSASGFTDHQFYQRPAGAPATDLSPLSRTAQSGDLQTLENLRYDLAGTSIDGYRTILTQFVEVNPSGSGDEAWWNDELMSGSRFRARPFVLGGPGARLSPADVALQAPIFLVNCPHFIVEFAGDFMAQSSNGSLDTSKPTDGEIDFVYDPNDQTRRVRWYGLPRDTSGHYSAPDVFVPGPDGMIRKDDGDVVPVRDYLGTNASFERIDKQGANPIGVLATAPMQDYASWPDTSPYTYTCAWGPKDAQRPSMFRILFAIDDPNGRFDEPLMFEYVFKVP